MTLSDTALPLDTGLMTKPGRGHIRVGTHAWHGGAPGAILALHDPRSITVGTPTLNQGVVTKHC